MIRKSILGLAAAGALLSLTGPTQAQDYPSDTIHIVVPWGAGGGTDAIARALAAAMEEVAGQAVVVDNIGGAAGATGSFQVAQADPDGYTVLLNGSSDLTAPLVFQDLPFGLDDFEYVGGFYVTPTWMVSHADRGYESFDDFVAAAEEKPDQLTLGVGGATNAHALMAHSVKGYLDLPVRIINYQGGAAMNRAILANEVDAGVIHAPVMLNEIREGLVNVLISGGPLEGISHEPLRATTTLQDKGMPFEVGVTRGLMVPAGTPEDVVARLSEITREAAESQAFAEFGDRFGFAPVWLDGDAFEEVVRGELATFQDIHSKFIAQ